MSQPPDDRRRGLEPPRFGLASMMIAMAVLGAVFASITYFGSLAAMVIIVFGLGVVAHVAANALGTKLRDHGSLPVADDETRSAEANRAQRPTEKDFAPATRLRKRTSLGRPIVIATAIGVLFGMVFGGVGLSYIVQEDATLGTLALGAFAAGIIGGIWTFMAASFLQVAFGAAWQASKGQ